jgi:EAL domain-containing protein (putative c-di-GMP-specific phosphodiesterase class I)
MSQRIKKGLEKTLKNPYTYLGALTVGTVSYLTKDFTYGVLSPFLIPIIVQAGTRIGTIYKNNKEEIIQSEYNLSSLEKTLQETPAMSYALLELNHSREVVRISQHSLKSQGKFIKECEKKIKKHFNPNEEIIKISPEEYLIISLNNIEELEEKINTFQKEVHKTQININGEKYFPKFFISYTSKESENPETNISKLDYGIKKRKHEGNLEAICILNSDAEYQRHREYRGNLKKVHSLVEEKKLGLFRQPIFSLIPTLAENTQKYELLLRPYIKNNQGIFEATSPQSFFEIARYNNILTNIDNYVLQLASNYFSQYNFKDGETYSINLDGQTLLLEDFISKIKEIFPKEQRKHFIFEITETLLQENITKSIKKLEEIRELGFQLSLDDIGIGSSNLSSLTSFPVDFYKLDRSFVHNCLNNTTSKQIVEFLVSIGKENKKQLIVEGVENQETLSFFQNLGVQYVQSFFTGKPTPFILPPGLEKDINT